MNTFVLERGREKLKEMVSEILDLCRLLFCCSLGLLLMGIFYHLVEWQLHFPCRINEMYVIES